MAEKNFAITPSVSISRSKFLRTNNHKTTFKLGEIVPLYVDEVLPGDTRSINFSALVRMSTPVFPIMDDIEMEVFAFFVPNRIVWKDWKQFMGESPTAGYAAFSGTFPYCTLGTSAKAADCLGAYLGLPTTAQYNNHKVSALYLRTYLSIYNRWFRDQNVEAPCYVDDTDGFDACTDSSGTPYTYAAPLLVAYKKSDYFTRALPYAQKGLPVSLPLGSSAPIKTIPLNDVDTSLLSTNPMYWAMSAGGVQSIYQTNGYLAIDGTTTPTGRTTAAGNSNDVTSRPSIWPANLVADLSKATAATINQLREAFQLQKLLEKDALYGTRYWELLYGHFGVRSPDATLQDPEYLGGHRFMINVDQVLQTTGSDQSTPANNSLGVPGANSVTGTKNSLFTKSFVEHGTLMILGVARQRQHTYGQGIMPMWQRFDRYDYYWPEFANLGAQEIKKIALYSADPNYNQTFGYQEAWADYRFKPSIVSGLLNPSVTGSFDFMTLADGAYGSAPTLSQSFLKEDRANLARCLVTGSNGPDFIADFYFQDVAVRPMPLYSIPGLIDHH